MTRSLRTFLRRNSAGRWVGNSKLALELRDHHSLVQRKLKTTHKTSWKCWWETRFMTVAQEGPKNQTVGLGGSVIPTGNTSHQHMSHVTPLLILCFHYYHSLIVPVSHSVRFSPHHHLPQSVTPSDSLCNMPGSKLNWTLLDLRPFLSSKWLSSVITLQPEWETWWRGRETGWQTQTWQGRRGNVALIIHTYCRIFFFFVPGREKRDLE